MTGILVLTASHDGAALDGGAAGPTSLSIASNLLAVPGVESLDGREQEHDQFLADRANPSAAEARQASRTSYERLDTAAAARVIANTVPAVERKSPSGIGRLPAGVHVSRYLGVDTASVSLPGGKRALVESLTPMAAHTSDGRYAPVDLSLHEAAGQYVANNPAASVSISKSLAGGVKLDSTGVSLTPVDVSGAPLTGDGRLEGAAVVYPNTATDVDTAAKAIASGAEIYSTLRSVDSPQTLDYRVGMPGGASLHRSGAAGAATAAVIADGRTLAVIPAASAVDAEGAPVPVSTAISGHTLQVTVDHRSGDYRYPIVVDPTVIDSNLTGLHSVKSNWRFEAGGGTEKQVLGFGGSGSTWEMIVKPWVVTNEWGSLNYPTQGESHIYELSMETAGGMGSAVENHLGIIGKGAWEGSLTLAKTYARSGATVCVAFCASSGGTAGNVAVYWINAIANGNGVNGVVGTDYAYAGSVYIAQTNGPTIAVDTTKEMYRFSKNIFYGSGAWMSKFNGNVAEFDETDPGVGVSSVEYTVAGKKWTYSLYENFECNYSAQCPPAPNTGVQQGNGGGLADGEPTIEAKAFDSMGTASSVVTGKLKIDSTVPYEITLSGLPGSGEIDDSTRNLKLTGHAKDGVTGTPSSGIASLKLAVDGQEIGGPNGTCSPGPCTATGEWTINGEQFSAGKHTFTVTATDAAGNSATGNTTFTVHHASTVSIGPGSFNPVTGRFGLAETDASITAAGAKLGVSRSYSSRSLTDGEGEAFGAPWVMSFGGADELVREGFWNATLISASGARTAFVYSGGRFEAPAGDKTLVLTMNAGETEYTLSDDGNTTKFTHVSGDEENVYRAAFVIGTGGYATTQYTYQVVGEVLEPLQELAPVPTGVSCTPTLNPGCRALTFNFATSTTATGEGASKWGDYTGRLTRVYFNTAEIKAGKLEQVSKTIAQYAYDSKGRLRAAWDPRVSPALKTTYGYDSEGHVTSMSKPGQEPWAFTYGTIASDTSTGRLLKVMQPPATESLWNGEMLSNTAAPALSGSPVVKVRMSVSNGTWSNGPVAYGYQWEDCNSSGAECKAIGGATNANYTPVANDVGHTLVAQVTAISGGGSVLASSAASAVVATAASGAPSVTQSIEAGSLNAVSCIPGTTDCVVSDSKGNAYYSTNMSTSSVASWTSWTGPGFSPSEALTCPTTSLCLMAAGERGGWGGYLYYATSLGGSWTQATAPANGIDAVSCASTSMCVAGQDKSGGLYRYSTSPAGTTWPLEKQGTAPMLGVFCLSSSFCVRADGAGKVYVATSTAQIESSTWAESSVDGTTVLNGVSCTSTSSCIVVDTAGNVLNLTVASGGEATATKQNIDGSNNLTAVTCTSATCVTVDNQGNAFVSADSGKTWVEQYQLKHALTSVSCASTTLCATVDTSGNLTAFNPSFVQPVEANGLNAVACVPGTTDCVVSDNKGGAYYSTNVSVGGTAAWTSWSGPTGISPSEALSCPATSLCVMADGSKEGFGGNVYYATSLGGAWTAGAEPSYGSDTVSCASTSFCVEGQDNLGYFRYATSPASSSWNLEDQGSNAMKGVFCLSSSFCAMVDSKGKAYVATSTGQIESSTWTESTVDGTTTLNGVSCTSTSSCVAVDSSGNVVNMTVAESGSVTASTQSLTSNSLTAVSCTGSVCVSVDNKGDVFVSGDSGKNWNGQYQLKDNLTSVSCPSSTLCMTVDTTGHAVAVNPSVSIVSEGEAHSPQAGSTIEYGLPVSGTASPYALGSSDVAKWAQTDLPVEATAVFSPDETQGWPASDYHRATVDYLDSADRLVNVASPGGAITTNEYNSYNDVVRRLTPLDRELSLKEGSKSAEVSQTLDTQSTYGSEGTELLSTLAPTISVKRSSGATVQARGHTVYSYDEGAPAGGPYRLVTKVTKGAQIAGESEADVRTTTTSYAGQNGLGWSLRQPTATRTDPSGLKLIRTTIYDPSTGNVTETRSPAAGAPNEEVLSGYFYKSTFGSYGTANGQFNESQGIARDAEGNLWVADTENNRVEEFSAGGTFIQKFGGPGTSEGQLSKPYGIAIDKWGNVWVTNTGKNYLDGFTKTGTYFKSLGSGGLLKEPMGIAWSNYNSRLYVTDAGDGRVLEFNPEKESEWTIIGKKGAGNGEFSYPEGIAVEQSSGNIIVADTTSRIQRLSATGTYISQFGSGYMKNPVGMALDSEGNVLVADAANHRIDSFSSSGTYQYSFSEYGTGEHQMRYPTGLVFDDQGNLFVMDPGNNRVQKWIPAASEHKSSGNGGTHGMQTIYYTTETNTEASVCGNHPEWAGLVCEKRPAAQPETSGLPNLPVTTVTYNIWDQPLVSTETVGTTTRTTTNSYDEAGRVSTQQDSSSVGTALPTVSFEYESETGLTKKQSTTVEGTTRSLEYVYNRLGAMTSYKDADGNTSTYTYDGDGRQETVNDGKGTQTYSYDSTTGSLTKLVDSAVGTFTATHDADNNLLTVGFPNGMTETHTYDAGDVETGVEYVKTTHCSSNCTWYSESLLPSIHGQTLSQTSTFSSEAYAYDAAGRLTSAQETPTGEGCTTRIYAYDEETNISSLTTRPPGTGGACATEGGTAENRSYDSANRLTDSGIAYDTFGDVTKLPAADAGGHEASSSYYVDETLASQTQNGQTVGYYLDPRGRQRQDVSTGTVNSTVTLHYADGTTSPAWTEDTSGNWTRDISGIGGGLVATQTDGEAPVLQIEDMHKNIVGTAPISETATGLLTKGESTEYGVPRTGSPARYAWLGALQLATELPSGIIAMGARSYVPQMGRFLQPDPVEGGSANAYAYTYGDPVNTSDPTGEFTVATPGWVGEFLDEQAEAETEAAIQRAAEEQAAREEAEEKAREASEETWEESGGSGGNGGGGKGKKHKGRKSKTVSFKPVLLSAGLPPGTNVGNRPPHKSKRHRWVDKKNHCLIGEVQVGEWCEKGPEKIRPDPPPPPPLIWLDEGENEVETAVDDCLASGLCDF